MLSYNSFLPFIRAKCKGYRIELTAIEISHSHSRRSYGEFESLLKTIILSSVLLTIKHEILSNIKKPPHITEGGKIILSITIFLVHYIYKRIAVSKLLHQSCHYISKMSVSFFLILYVLIGKKFRRCSKL